MNTEFLKQFEKDIDKLSLQSVKEDIIATIENVENAETLADIDI